MASPNEAQKARVPERDFLTEMYHFGLLTRPPSDALRATRQAYKDGLKKYNDLLVRWLQITDSSRDGACLWMLLETVPELLTLQNECMFRLIYALVDGQIEQFAQANGLKVPETLSVSDLLGPPAG